MPKHTFIGPTFIRFKFIRPFLNRLQAYSVGFLHLFYPHICMHCGSEELSPASVLCTQCVKNLPYTQFLPIDKNTIEKNITALENDPFQSIYKSFVAAYQQIKML